MGIDHLATGVRPAGHHIVPTARTTVQGIVARATANVVVAPVAGQDVVVGAADEVLHIRQRFSLLKAPQRPCKRRPTV